MYTQLNLVKNIMETADTCVTLPHPGATMRFAHESDVLPLVCLLNINGCFEKQGDALRGEHLASFLLRRTASAGTGGAR